MVRLYGVRNMNSVRHILIYSWSFKGKDIYSIQQIQFDSQMGYFYQKLAAFLLTSIGQYLKTKLLLKVQTS